MKPDFKIVIGGFNATSKLKDRLLSLTINDDAGVKSDTVKIELDDRGNRLIEPPDDAIILVFLGYEGMPLFPMGIFILDRVEYDIAPDRMIIHGKAADFGGTLKEQKARNWDEKTIGEIVETIAGEHDLAPRVADAFKDIKYEYLAQNAESDINFLTRIGKDHDALVSVKQLKDSEKRALLFAGRGEGKSASGLSLPQAWIFKSQVLQGSRITKSKATIYKSVEDIRVWRPLGTMMRRGIVRRSCLGKVPPNLRSHTPTLPKMKPSAPPNPSLMNKPAPRTPYPCG